MRDEMTRSEIKKEAVSWFKTVLYAVCFALFVTTFIIVNAEVPTGSMENTIMIGDRIVAFRLSYLIKKPERLDVVVFRYPVDESQLFVKRIIGLPGETLEIVNGKVFIDGNALPLDEPYLREIPITTKGTEGPFVIPDDHYFMMGDNRNFSSDAREWSIKYVEDKKILGKVIFGYYPKFKLFFNKY